MYSEQYRKQHEISGMMFKIDTVSDDKTLSPPDAVEAVEEGIDMLTRLLRETTSKDERALLHLIDELFDELIDETRVTRKFLRGKLRKKFLAQGGSVRHFYASFYSLQKRICS